MGESSKDIQKIMLSVIVFAALGGMAGFVAWEWIQEARGGKSQLHDRYHE